METRAIRVLYIDDDPGLARLVRRTLEARGYQVEHAFSGEEGLARIEKGGIDIVALDHHMPGQTGLDILPAIKALSTPPPVVYVTGSEDSRVAVSALKAGAIDYVWKDVQGEFRELLAEAITNAYGQDSLRKAKEAAEVEMREARERAEMLLREVNHRVANSLALLAALVAMQQKAAITDPIAAREALISTQSRITAIAQIHRRLYTSEDVRFVEMDAYLHGLVEELETAMQASGRLHPIHLQADDIQVPTDKAVSVGVIVTELVTNAYKYAYPVGVDGVIRVIFRRADDQVVLTVEDDGVGVQNTTNLSGTGLGTKIVRAMAANLRATVAFDPAHLGTRVVVPFAL